MTVRCDACGTENRDKAMFCRGCAGKLPAFALAKKPPAGESKPPIRPAASASRGSMPRTADPGSASSSLAGGSLFGGTRMRLALFALLMIALGASIAWFARGPTGSGESAASTPSHQPVTGDRLPAENSLSAGETLVREGSGNPSAPLGDMAPSSGATTPPASSPASPAFSAAATDRPSTSAESAEPSNDPAPLPRSAGRRPPAHPAGARAADPRAGCEHLFFAFAARCEANHCQQAAYARHPRCDAVREQRRRDDARRNSMPIS